MKPDEPLDAIAAAERLDSLVGNKFRIEHKPGLYAGKEGDGANLLLGRFIEDPDEDYHDHCSVYVDLTQPDPRRQLVTELRRVASMWSGLANKVENPKGAPPLTYAVISVPDGEIRGRGYSRESADHIAFIWNQDLEHHKRAAVIPDADLRHLRVAVGDLLLVNDEQLGQRFKHQWPTYAVGIYEDGKLARIERLQDQRLAWCEAFNANHKGLSTHAVPLFAFAGEDEEGGDA